MNRVGRVALLAGLLGMLGMPTSRPGRHAGGKRGTSHRKHARDPRTKVEMNGRVYQFQNGQWWMGVHKAERWIPREGRTRRVLVGHLVRGPVLKRLRREAAR